MNYPNGSYLNCILSISPFFFASSLQSSAPKTLTMVTKFRCPKHGMACVCVCVCVWPNIMIITLVSKSHTTRETSKTDPHCGTVTSRARFNDFPRKRTHGGKESKCVWGASEPKLCLSSINKTIDVPPPSIASSSLVLCPPLSRRGYTHLRRLESVFFIERKTFPQN